jgi:hypothetical protein
MFFENNFDILNNSIKRKINYNKNEKLSNLTDFKEIKKN